MPLIRDLISTVSSSQGSSSSFSTRISRGRDDDDEGGRDRGGLISSAIRGATSGGSEGSSRLGQIGSFVGGLASASQPSYSPSSGSLYDRPSYATPSMSTTPGSGYSYASSGGLNASCGYPARQSHSVTPQPSKPHSRSKPSKRSKDPERLRLERRIAQLESTVQSLSSSSNSRVTPPANATARRPCPEPSFAHPILNDQSYNSPHLLPGLPAPSEQVTIPHQHHELSSCSRPPSDPSTDLFAPSITYEDAPPPYTPPRRSKTSGRTKSSARGQEA